VVLAEALDDEGGLLGDDPVVFWFWFFFFFWKEGRVFEGEGCVGRKKCEPMLFSISHHRFFFTESRS